MKQGINDPQQPKSTAQLLMYLFKKGEFFSNLIETKIKPGNSEIDFGV